MESRRFRPPAPPADRLVRWPDDFGSRFLVTVDVEEEFDWSRPLDRNARATTAMAALPDAARRLRAMGTGLTCLVDHPAATAAGARDLLGPVLDDPGSAIGAQLHPWVTPPFFEGEGEAGANGYAGNLAPGREAAKLSLLTGTIEDRLGRRPLLYRAGRYGLGPSTTRLLAELGYRADSSIRARYDYRADGGPDYRHIGPDAFVAASDVVELPLTTVHTGLARRGGAALHGRLSRVPYGPGAAARLGLLRRVALTPEDMPAADAVAAVRAAAADGLRLLVLSFHSPSLVPGHTPYVRDAAGLLGFWRWWDVVLAALDRLGIRSASLAEVFDAALQDRAPRATAPSTPGSGAAW